MPIVPGDTYTVRELTAELTALLADRFPDEVWVEGEIASLNRSSRGHVYFQLVEPTADDEATTASIPIALFASARERVNRILRAAGGSVRMSDGLQIRIKARVDLYEPSGKLQLKMSGIDPSYTLGLLESARDRLLRQLELEGLLRRNAAAPFAEVPLRVGLVTSGGSAAEADFLHELRASGYAWRVVHCDSRVQGPGAERDIATSLRALARHRVDAIALVRGGGARTDLAIFDSEIVARTIAGLDIPVITGIGHEIDTSVADLVAHTICKTPTACAAMLTARVRGFMDRTEALWLRLDHATRARLDTRERDLDHVGLRVRREAAVAVDRSERRVDRDAGRVEGSARHHVRSHDIRLVDASHAISTRAPRALNHAARTIDLLASRASALDPDRALARGWSITRTAAGTVLRGADDVRPGDEMLTTLASGTIHSRVETIETRTDHPTLLPTREPTDAE